jgi:hypothetical protein
MLMGDDSFIELQRECFNFVSVIFKAQFSLPKNLEVSTINETVLADLAAFARAGCFTGPVDFTMSKTATAGVGLPLRLVTYYDRKPLGYLCGSYENGKFFVYHWELSNEADAELHSKWLRIVVNALEFFAVCFEAYTDQACKVDVIAFTSPSFKDGQQFEKAKFKFTEDIYKGMPAYYLDR